MAYLNSFSWYNNVSVFSRQNKQAHKSLWFATAGTILLLLLFAQKSSDIALNAATDMRCRDGLLLSLIFPQFACIAKNKNNKCPIAG